VAFIFEDGQRARSRHLTWRCCNWEDSLRAYFPVLEWTIQAAFSKKIAPQVNPPGRVPLHAGKRMPNSPVILSGIRWEDHSPAIPPTSGTMEILAMKKQSLAGASWLRGGYFRCGLAAALFLECNGYQFQATEEEAVLETLALAAGGSGAAEFTAWLEKNCVVIS